MKLISFAVPCYNSEAYMHRCIDSLLSGGTRVEIILVDDGSTDRTGEIADSYQEKYPEIIKVIHKENGGHGSGIMAGLEAAEGLYYKVIDSDDWADQESLMKLLDLIETFEREQKTIDLFICNYVYEHVGKKPHTIHYRGIFPHNRMFGWSECGVFDITRYMTMHSVFYRTALVRKSDLQIPLHTFYVDNIYLYTPLPLVKTLYYCDTDFYRYFIGRVDQSVNEAVIIKRVDQQILVSKLVLERHDLEKIRPDNPKLYRYMLNYSSVMVLVASVFLTLDGSKEAMKKLKDFWIYLKTTFPNQYGHFRYRSLAGIFSHTNRVFRFFSVAAYRLVRKIYKFN